MTVPKMSLSNKNCCYCASFQEYCTYLFLLKSVEAFVFDCFCELTISLRRKKTACSGQFQFSLKTNAHHGSLCSDSLWLLHVTTSSNTARHHWWLLSHVSDLSTFCSNFSFRLSLKPIWLLIYECLSVVNLYISFAVLYNVVALIESAQLIGST